MKPNLLISEGMWPDTQTARLLSQAFNDAKVKVLKVWEKGNHEYIIRLKAKDGNTNVKMELNVVSNVIMMDTQSGHVRLGELQPGSRGRKLIKNLKMLSKLPSFGVAGLKGLKYKIESVNESTKEYSKTLDKIAKSMEAKKSISKKDRDTLMKIAKLMKKANESVNRDYKAEYKKYGSSTKAKKYRAELNQYNRKRGTYGNGDGKDASHKGGKIVGFESQSKNRGRAEKSRLKSEVLSRGGAIELFGQAKYLGQGIKDMTKAYKKKDWAQMEEEVDYIVTKAKLMGDIVNQKRYQESVNEARTINVEPNWEGMWRFFKQMAKTNPSDWKKMQRTMGSEWLKIDKMAQQKGWKSESVNEGRKGPGAYINTFEKLLKKQMGKDFDKKPPSEKDIERVMGLMRKRYGEPNMYEKRHTESTDEVNIKKQLLKKFGKDPLYKDVIMAKNPKEMKKTMATLKSIRGGNALTLMRKYVQKLMEISESGIMYRAGVKRYGKEGMTKIQSAAGSGAGHAEIGKIKDKYDKKRKKKESVNEGIKDPKLKVGQKIRYKKGNRVYTLKKITHGNSGIPEDPAGTSYMFVAPGNRKEYHTKKTWAQAIKKGWLSLESVNEAGTKSIDGEELLNFLMKRFKMSKKKAIDSMKKHNMDMSFLKKESINEATGVHIKLVDSITRLILSGRDDKIAYDRLKMILKQRDSLISGKESSGVYNLIYKELFNGIYSAIGKVRKKYKLESVNESDLGLTLKKGKTITVTHKKSGKEIVIIDKPSVRKEYEKIGFYAESVNESRANVKKAIAIAKKMGGNMTGAVKKIERIQKGLSKQVEVEDALRTANESVNEAVEPKGNMAKIFKIVKDKQYAKISGTIVDLFSASALVKIFDALNDSNKEKLNKMNMNKLSFILSKAFKDKVVV